MNGANLTLAHAARAERPERPICRISTCRRRPRFAGGISKALTSSYFSSVGAAFSSRTANDILQETLPPSAATRGLESGPLFSVQFSQLPCSDVSSRFPNRVRHPSRSARRRRRSGLLPALQNGTVVGAVAVVGDGVYGFDTEYRDNDRNVEEIDRARRDDRLRAADGDPRRPGHASTASCCAIRTRRPPISAATRPPRRPSPRSTASVGNLVVGARLL